IGVNDPADHGPIPPPSVNRVRGGDTTAFRLAGDCQMLATSPFVGHHRQGIARSLIAVGLVLGWVAAAAPPVQPDQAAATLLARARNAYNDHNYPQAVAWFKGYLGKYGGNRAAPAARYGLALALLEMPEKDYQGAVEQLQPLVNNKEFADRPYVLYYLGL